MSKFTAALNNSENPLYQYLRTDGPRDIGAYLVQTGTIGEAYPELDYDKVEVFATPSTLPREDEAQEVMLHGIELIMFVGSLMASNYEGALEFSHVQAKELLGSEEFAIFNGDDLEAKGKLMEKLTASSPETS